MNKNIFLLLLLAGILSFAGAIPSRAQTPPSGKYYHDKKIDEGRHDFRMLFEFRSDRTVVYSNEQEGAETQRRFGKWTWNQKAKQLTVDLPPVKNNPMQGQEVRLTFVFRVVGRNLELIRDLPYREGKGEIYRPLR